MSVLNIIKEKERAIQGNNGNLMMEKKGELSIWGYLLCGPKNMGSNFSKKKKKKDEVLVL